MKNKRQRAGTHRKYQMWQLKPLLRKIESRLSDLNSPKLVFTIEQSLEALNDVQDMFFEIALRLD